MINLKPIEPMLREDYISPHLQEEERRREIEPMPAEPGKSNWLERAWLFVVRVITEILRY